MSRRAPVAPAAWRGLGRAGAALAGPLVETYRSLRFAGRLVVLITAGLAGEAAWAALRACRSIGRAVLGHGAAQDGSDGGSR